MMYDFKKWQYNSAEKQAVMEEAMKAVGVVMDSLLQEPLAHLNKTEGSLSTQLDTWLVTSRCLI